MSLCFHWLPAQPVWSSSCNASKIHWNTEIKLYRCSDCSSQHHPRPAQAAAAQHLGDVWLNRGFVLQWAVLCFVSRNIKSAPNFMFLFTLCNSSSRTSFAYLTRRTVGKRLLNPECCRAVFDSKFHKKVNTDWVSTWSEVKLCNPWAPPEKTGEGKWSTGSKWAKDSENRARGEEEGENASKSCRCLSPKVRDTQTQLLIFAHWSNLVPRCSVSTALLWASALLTDAERHSRFWFRAPLVILEYSINICSGIWLSSSMCLTQSYSILHN